MAGKYIDNDNRKTPRNSKRRSTIAVALWCLAIGLSIHTVATFFYVATPMSFWLDYRKVEPIKNVFRVGEKLKFKSEYHVLHDINVGIQDMLICNVENDDLEFYLYSIANKVYQFKKGCRRVDVFTLHEVVQDPAICYLRAGVEVNLPLNIKKFQTYKSQEFKIVAGK